MHLVDRRYHVRQGCALEVPAAFKDAGGGYLRPLAVGGHRHQPSDGLAVARDGQAFAQRDAVKQPRQVLAPQARISSLTS